MDKSEQSNPRIAAYARELFEAERTRISIAPFTKRDPGFSIDDAYAVQMENVRRVLIGKGHSISGKKIGLTSAGIQKQFGVSEPDYGHLFKAMECPGGIVNTSELIQPKIEAELAFILKADLTGGDVGAKDVIDATGYVTGAFEIVDSRIEGWRIKLPDTVADNASSGRYVLGQTRIRAEDIDLSSVSMKMYKLSGKKQEPVGEGTGAAVLGNPCLAVAWLANKLWEYGVELKAGEIVLSGAFSAAPAAAKGDVFRAEFSDFGWVEARFV